MDLTVLSQSIGEGAAGSRIVCGGGAFSGGFAGGGGRATLKPEREPWGGRYADQKTTGGSDREKAID